MPAPTRRARTQTTIVAALLALTLSRTAYAQTEETTTTVEPTTTTSTTAAPPTTTTTVDPCQWERGGIAETPAQPCESDGQSFGLALLIFTAAALFALLAFARLR